MAGHSVTERLDVRPPSPKNGPPELRVFLVERRGADSTERWHRALEILLEAGITPGSDDEDDD